MTYLARFVVSSKWADFALEVQAGLSPDQHLECPVIVLYDLITKTGDSLSFWEIDPEDEEQVNRIVAAYCGMQKNLGGVKLRWVDYQVLIDLGIEAKRTAAKGCPDAELAANRHWDLTARKVGSAAQLAVAMASNDSIERTPVQVASYIVSALRNGRFNWKSLKPEMVAELLRDGHVNPQL